MRIYKDISISASHQLRIPYDSPCNRLHGHNYRVEVWIEDAALYAGMVADFNMISQVVKQYDHKHLNDALENPTAENFVSAILAELQKGFAGCQSIRVRIWESPTCYAEDDWKRQG